jgi:hypothetical protein
MAARLSKKRLPRYSLGRGDSYVVRIRLGGPSSFRNGETGWHHLAAHRRLIPGVRRAW